MGEDKSALSTEVHIICGPPGSGKTTFVQKHMQPGDLILDMDAIVAALTGNKSTHPDYSNVMNTALAVRETIYKYRTAARLERLEIIKMFFRPLPIMRYLMHFAGITSISRSLTRPESIKRG